MNQIRKSEIVKQVKKEYKEGRDWCRCGRGRCYTMMIDTDDGDIWSDVFLSIDDWKRYHSDTIQRLETVPGYVKEREDGYVDSAIKLLTAAGWTIID